MNPIHILIPLLALAATGCTNCNSAPPLAPDSSGNQTLFQFSQGATLRGWEVEDDAVMGGRSKGRLSLNEAGNAVFAGDVSLENDGGFSSVQYDFGPIDASAYRAIVLGLKGDGKRYQLRVDSEKKAPHSYACDFQTSGDWQTVEIPFADLAAIRHGDRLDLPPYPGQTLARLQILIGNDTPESFQLEIDRIWLIK
ncbi:MAG TPA: CIA30 family protein [Verrucomicrobia bacterium]|nr:CIA30 family protein [Verrucomicrobiota bacterium]